MAGTVRNGQRATLNGKSVLADGRGNWRENKNGMPGEVVGSYEMQKGMQRNWGKQQWDGKSWVDMNVVHAGQRAVSGGQDVEADGKGNWIALENGMPTGRSVSTYKPGEDRKPKTNRPAVDLKALSAGAQDLRSGPTPLVKTTPPKPENNNNNNNNNNGRDSKKTNADGIEQSGTQMSTLSDFNTMYERVVGKDNFGGGAVNPFESVHLHTGQDNRGDMVHGGKSSYTKEEADGYHQGGLEWNSDQKADAPYTIAKPADVASTEGAPKIVQSGAGKVVKGVNGHEFGGDHEAPATMKRDRTSELRRKWMTGDMKDDKGNDLSSIQRLRGMRMEQGFDRQGTKFYAMGSLDPANKSKRMEVSEDQYRQAVVSDAGKQQVVSDLRDAYTAKIKADNNPTTTDTQFVPDTSGLTPQVSEAVGMTQAPVSFNADGPKDERADAYAQDFLNMKKPLPKR